MYRKKDGKPYKAPSAARAEVGAIEAIEIAPPEDKRTFSTAAAVSMLADPRTVSGYQIELFETPSDRVIADDPSGRAALQRSLERVLLSFGNGTRAYVSAIIGRTPVLEMQLTRGGERALIDNRVGVVRGDISGRRDPVEIDRSPERHEAALVALQRHPLVRAIRPPVQLQLTDQEAASQASVESAPLNLPKPASEARYPIVGVIDSGIAPVLNDWVIGRFDYMDASEYDPGHGTGVAGLITFAQLVNPPSVAPEPNGCMVYDAPLYPKGSFLATYAKGFSDFLEELEQAVTEAKEKHGVRIFNLSINAISDVERYRYSIYAARLDQIADTHGVIFVNSAGNLPRTQTRAPWPKRPAEVIGYFAARTSADTIYKPAESVRSVAVGALNPPGQPQVAFAPTTYTTRGPGLQVGVKPDVCAVGGAGVSAGTSTGLASVSTSGMRQDVAGTSYAAPLVARALAGLDAATEGGLSLEALRAMLVHHAAMPEPLTKRGLKDLARQFAGFGQIGSVTNMLETDDHQITLLFQSRLTIGERKPVILRFPFEWPQSLVQNGACSGRARITLVYAPPLDPAFGAEFVRVNLEASLTQRQTEPSKDGGERFTNQIDARYLPNSSKFPAPEKALINHGLKWWPVKQYESNFKANGESDRWRLEVTSLVRAESYFPAEGVPFAVLLTLEDPDGQRPVFQQFRQALSVGRANAQDVRTVSRVRARG
ncbi:S8 family peptidase [Reyranella sp.]|uniref:S8 family peptidase n=1 Tax=Reyranella sp. TaxID=1929291 RepID=UPI0025EB2FEF|nr:S8 family peptidase [Reyranella sp.]